MLEKTRTQSVTAKIFSLSINHKHNFNSDLLFYEGREFIIMMVSNIVTIIKYTMNLHSEGEKLQNINLYCWLDIVPSKNKIFFPTPLYKCANRINQKLYVYK